MASEMFEKQEIELKLKEMVDEGVPVKEIPDRIHEEFSDYDPEKLDEIIVEHLPKDEINEEKMEKAEDKVSDWCDEKEEAASDWANQKKENFHEWADEKEENLNEWCDEKEEKFDNWREEKEAQHEEKETKEDRS